MLSFVAALVLSRQGSDLLANVRHAVAVENGKAWAETTMTGKAEYYSIPGTYSLRFTQDGKFIQTVVNPLGDVYGYDGKTNWQADYTGATREFGFESADTEQGVLMLLTDRWLDPSAPVDVAADGSQLHVKLRGSGFEEVVNIDVATNLPTGATFTGSAGLVMIGLSDWRAAGGHKLPFKATVTSGGLTDTFQVLTATGSRDPGMKAFSKPAWKPKDVKFDMSQPAEIESKKAFTGHILVHPRVNGQDVGWFILDSGAEVMVIDPAVADGLKLPKIGKEELVGVGGTSTSAFRTSDSFTLGRATMRDVKYSELDLSPFGKIMGVKVAGIVGYDLMRRTVLGVDLKTPKVTLDDPANYHLPSGEWQPMWFDSGNPVVQASFEGDRKAFFRLDTGANGTVTFHGPYAAQEHLLDNRATVPAGMGGVGGNSMGRMGRMKWFELGGHRFENPLVVFSQATAGAFMTKNLAGNIGQEFMAPFTVVLDFGGSRVAFLPKPTAKN